MNPKELTLDDIILSLNRTKELTEKLKASIPSCEVGVTHEEDCGWVLWIDYPIQTNDPSSDGISTYTVCFADHEELLNHIQAMYDAIRIVNCEEV